MFSRLLAALNHPAILLAFVPLIRLGFETLFRHVFGNSTQAALAEAQKSTIADVKSAVEKEDVRAALAAYVDNASDLQRFFEICFFSGVSLLVWGLTEADQTYERLINTGLFLTIVVALVWVGVKTLKDRYEPGRRDVSKGPRRFAYILNLVIVVLEVTAALAKR